MSDAFASLQFSVSHCFTTVPKSPSVYVCLHAPAAHFDGAMWVTYNL